MKRDLTLGTLLVYVIGATLLVVHIGLILPWAVRLHYAEMGL